MPPLNTQFLTLATFAVFAALAVLSVMAVTVAVFKTLQFRKLGVGARKQGEAILGNWLSGQADEALRLATLRKSVLARVLHAVFSGVQAKPGDTAYAEELGRQTALLELAAMTDRMRLLEMVVQSAPMLGLLGTVVGMINAFSVLSMTQGTVDPAQLAGGIWTALTTTAVGLAVALVAYFVANRFDARIERERTMIEAAMSAAIYGRVDPNGASLG
jgi:biopolymer transport protein ExbB